jgi:hypothetical protein
MKFLSRVLVFALLSTGIATAQTATEEPRQSLTAEGHGITRGSVSDGKVTYNEHAPLRLNAPSTSSGKDLEARQQIATIGESADPNFWFYAVDVDLFSDYDNDGYFFGIDLWFDADTNYAIADVYAVIFLSYEFGPWEEYAETENFTLFGTAASDDYTVQTELISGYPTGDYDILIELYDADTNLFVASVGPDDSSELSYLPLEDSGRDARGGGDTQVVVNSGGGSLGWLLLLVPLAIRMTLRPQAARLSK